MTPPEKFYFGEQKGEQKKEDKEEQPKTSEQIKKKEAVPLAEKVRELLDKPEKTIEDYEEISRLLKAIEEMYESENEELLIAYKLKKYLEETKIGEIYPEIEADEKFKNSTIEKEMKNETLQKNALQDVINDINKGRQPETSSLAWYAFQGYSFLKSSGFWPEMKRNEKLKEMCEKIEEGMKNETLQKNALQRVIRHINKGQQPKTPSSAWLAFQGYSFLRFFISEMEKIGDKKMKQKELEKALYPQKNIPPRPEARSF